MTVGILGTFLLLVVALLGGWSRSTRLTVDGSTESSTELARTQLAAEDPAHAKMLVAGLVVLLVWMVGAHFWLPLPLAFLNTTSAQVTAFCVEHLPELLRAFGRGWTIGQLAGIPRNQIDLGAQIRDEFGQARGVIWRVVESAEQHIFKRQVFPRTQRVARTGPDQFLDGIFSVDGHDRVALFVRGGIQ